MDRLWSASTTMRNPERAYSFLKTLEEIEGWEWTKETQNVFQCLLIKNRVYVPKKEGLTPRQTDLLEDFSRPMSYEEARDIFDMRHYVDASMRGRVSFDPLEKLGLASLEAGEEGRTKKICITELGKKFLNQEITLEELVFSNLIKFQYPNPLSSQCRDYNTKPFINILRLIREVNARCLARGEKAKGISKEEFGIFALSIKSYTEVRKKSEDLLEYRKAMQSMAEDADQQTFRKDYIERYLFAFQNPERNIKEYTDNIVRYLRLTKYIFIHGRGGNYFIDLEPRRMVEINALLEHDSGAALPFTEEEYKRYIADINAYTLPFETLEKLKAIAEGVIGEIHRLESALALPSSAFAVAADMDIEALKRYIERLRDERARLQNLKLKADYQDISRIDEALEALRNIRNLGMKPSVALEKWANIAMNIIDDARWIKPNSPLGDDNEPVFTAPAQVPDLECYYEGFNAICEVTMLTGRDQWFNEGQPVMRHLRDFEEANPSVPSYCLFIAPQLHRDTLNTFWIAVKYEYEGKKQRIIPFTISQLLEVLSVVKGAKRSGRRVTQADLMSLYNDCLSLSSLNSVQEWTASIKKSLASWKRRLT